MSDITRAARSVSDDAHAYRQYLMDQLEGHLVVNRDGVKKDWVKSQLVAALSLAATFIATVWTATGYGLEEYPSLKLALTFVVAIPGFMVAIESGFQFASRVKIHTTAIYDLEQFKMRLKRGDDPFGVGDSFYKYMKEYAAVFPSGSVSPQLKLGDAGSAGTGSGTA